jgi:hypothetical protein
MLLRYVNSSSQKLLIGIYAVSYAITISSFFELSVEFFRRGLKYLEALESNAKVVAEK